LSVTTISHFTFSGTEFSRGAYFCNISVCVDIVKKRDSLLSLLELSEMGIRNDKGNLKNLLDSVTTSEDERGNSSSGNGRCNGVTLLVEIDLDVPFSPGLGGGKAATSSAHVSKGSLAGTVSSSSTDTRNTGYSSTSTPGFS
jgi:hypothetical protein